MSDLEPAGGSPEELRLVLQQAERSKVTGQKAGHTVRQESAQVVFNIWPSLIPRQSIVPTTLLRSIADDFGAVLDQAALLRGVPAELRGGMSLESVLSHAMNDMSAQVRFRGGHLRLADSNRVTAIERLMFAEQAISATVAGTTDEAEYLCKRLAILLSNAAGVKRVWSDFEPYVELITYTTATVVDLGFSLSQLLAPEVRTFISEKIDGPEGFGQKMGGSPTLTPLGKLNIITGVREIQFTVSITDPVSGRNEDCRIDLLVHTRTDMNRSRVKFQTELKSAHHEQLVAQLIHAITGNGALQMP